MLFYSFELHNRSVKMHAILIIDASGSMISDRNGTLDACATFIRDQQKASGTDMVFTLATFNEELRYIYEKKPIAEVKIEALRYTPDGGTALYDAIGHIITKFRDDEQVVFCLITDGQEEDSKDYTEKQVIELVKSVGDRWQMVYMASDINSVHHAEKLGFKTTIQYAGKASQSVSIMSRHISYARSSSGMVDVQALSREASCTMDVEDNTPLLQTPQAMSVAPSVPRAPRLSRAPSTSTSLSSSGRRARRILFDQVESKEWTD